MSAVGQAIYARCDAGFDAAVDVKEKRIKGLEDRESVARRREEGGPEERGGLRLHWRGAVLEVKKGDEVNMARQKG